DGDDAHVEFAHPGGHLLEGGVGGHDLGVGGHDVRGADAVGGAAAAPGLSRIPAAAAGERPGGSTAGIAAARGDGAAPRPARPGASPRTFEVAGAVAEAVVPPPPAVSGGAAVEVPTVACHVSSSGVSWPPGGGSGGAKSTPGAAG